MLVFDSNHSTPVMNQRRLSHTPSAEQLTSRNRDFLRALGFKVNSNVTRKYLER